MIMDRFWPGFIRGFLTDGHWRRDGFVEYVSLIYEEAGFSDCPVLEWVGDPIRYKDLLVHHIREGQYDGDGWFDGSDEPFRLVLENTPGFFQYTSQIHNGSDIYYTITEIITDLTPVSIQSVNYGPVKELADHVGVSMNVLINRSKSV